MCITKSKISMHTCRSRMSDAPKGAFDVIPEISLSDISYIIKKIFWKEMQDGFSRTEQGQEFEER